MALPLDLVVFGAERVCGRGADRAAGFLVVGAERVAWGRLGAVRAGADRVAWGRLGAVRAGADLACGRLGAVRAAGADRAVDREGAALGLRVERVCGDRLGVARLVDGAR